MSDCLDRVFQAATEIGMEAESFVLDGEWHRVRVSSKTRRNEDGAYCLSEICLRDGRRVVVGMLYNWCTRDERALTLEGMTNIDPEELAEARRLASEAAKKSKRERAEKHEGAAVRAAEIWAGLSEAGSSDYLRRKQVKAWGVRFANGRLAVPVRDGLGVMSSIQWINADGSKKFLTGGAKRGRFHLVGEVGGDFDGVLGVAEGYATAASIHESCPDIPVAVAFDAGNLAPASEALLGVYPKCKLVIFADDDRFGGYRQAFIRQRDASPAVVGLIERLGRLRPDVLVEVVGNDNARLREPGKTHNVGVAEAIIAAARVGGDVVFPSFGEVA